MNANRIKKEIKNCYAKIERYKSNRKLAIYYLEEVLRLEAKLESLEAKKEVVKSKTPKEVKWNKELLYRSLKFQVGVTDEVTVCGCCGKENLKKTVVFKVDEESEIDEHYVYLGSDCAKRVKCYRGVPRKKQPLKIEEIETTKITAKVRDGKTVELEYLPIDRYFYMTAINGSKVLKRACQIEYLLGRWQWEGDVERMKRCLERELEWTTSFSPVK